LQNSRSQDSGNCISSISYSVFLWMGAYWNCERKRKSPSKNSRKSLTP
jgi:hypothetical protein